MLKCSKILRKLIKTIESWRKMCYTKCIQKVTKGANLGIGGDSMTIIDVARYILDKTGSLTTMKLQKLCYYSQAWSLAWDEIPMFDDDFEAWANGPVNPNLFQYHRGKFTVSRDIFPPSNLKASQKEIIDKVLDFYGGYEPNELSELTHKERPWKEARQKANVKIGDSCNEIITKESIQEYYGGLS